ncbi:hypothetical protein GGH13_007234, partial [Coemansia sp. S155-1]
MGDIFSCQWISRDEYYRRIHRFKWISHQIDSKNGSLSGNHIYYHIAGNHDIGYGEETEPYHINRYTNNFGPLSREWLARIDGSIHRFAILNAMNLDKTRNIQYRQQAWQFVQQLVAERQERPDIPLILFSHIPLHKPAGACVASPSIRYQNDFVEYQDYLSPTTSAYLLHCLAPTFVLSGHDHNGCQAAHSVKTGVSQATPLGAAGKSLRSASDLCSLTFEELDEFQTEIEEFARQTVTPASGFDSAGTNAWDTLEVTVRSAMGEFDGAAGIFDIHKSGHYHPSSPQRYARALGRNVLASADGYEYRYREVMLGNHLAIQVELLALKDVTVAATGLARARGDDGVEAARDELVINGRLDGALAGKALGKGALGTGLLSLSGLGLVIDSLTLLLAEDLGITVLVPLTEGGSVDLDDGALHKGVGADKLVVGGV